MEENKDILTEEQKEFLEDLRMEQQEQMQRKDGWYMKLTKIKIEELVKEIESFLQKNDLLGDVCIYFNNKRHMWHNKYDENWNFLGFGCDIQEDISPLDYFEYANPKHILSMSFEGAFYEVLNGYSAYSGRMQERFLKLLNKYNLYYELGNAWNLTCYPTADDMEIEFTDYRMDVKPEPITIYSHSDVMDIPVELFFIKKEWDNLSSTTQYLGGSCTIGDGFEFNYKDIDYFMMSPSYQGSCIYEHWIETIKKKLQEIGARNIIYNYGRLDQ